VPVILLLGGTSGVGKTTLALEVARRLGIGRVLSTDSIRQVMRLMISRDLMPWIHASSFDAYLTLDATSEPRPTVLAGFRAQASSVAVGVRASIDRSVEEGAHLVVDGVSLLPGAIDEQLFAGRAVVVFVLVATLDESALGNRFELRAAGQPRRLAHRYVEHKKEILEIQRHLISEAERRGMPVVDNVDLDRSAREIIAHVLDRLRHEQRRVAAGGGGAPPSPTAAVAKQSGSDDEARQR
jgi:2-phosphoglycerate kinase